MPLEIAIQSFDIANMEARMQAMARPAYTAVSAAAAEGKPSILFVPTRKQARLTALDLLTYAAADGQPKRFLQVRTAHAAVCTTLYMSSVCAWNQATLRHSTCVAPRWALRALLRTRELTVRVLHLSLRWRDSTPVASGLFLVPVLAVRA